MKSKLIAVAVLVVLVMAGVHWYFGDRGRFTTAAEYTGLVRQVNGNDLVSGFDPALIMRFDASYSYLGGQKFVLYGVADTEQHFFGEITADNTVKSLYWVQFEAYLPDNSYRYDYDDSPGRMQLGAWDFFVDTAVIESDPAKRRRGTDGAMARALVRTKGYDFPQDFAYARLVHLTDESHRKELMVIFIEDLAPQGLTAAGLREDGAQAARWPIVEQAHLEKIQRTLELLPYRGGEGR